MTPTTPRRPFRVSPALLLFLGSAIAVGVAATFLRGAAPPSGGRSAPVALAISPSVIAFVLLGLVFVGFIILVIERIRNPLSVIPREWVIAMVVTLLVLSAFAVFARVESGPGTSVPTVPANNTTVGHGTGSGVPGGLGNSTNGTNGTIPVFGLHVPSWAFLTIALLAGIVAALVAVPLLISARRAIAAAKRVPPATEAAVEEDLGAALQALETSSDPRAVIVALYARLLARVGSLVGSVDAQTAEEIRSHHLLYLGVDPGSAEALTRLFERARYSSRPMGPGDAVRARETIEEALRHMQKVGLAG